MFIGSTQYQTSLADINDLRYILFTNFYNNPICIDILKEIINRNIECLGVEYSAYEYTFSIKIKKTAMRKIRGFKHDPIFYYQYISEIFKEFINSNKDKIAKILKLKYDDPYGTINYFISNPSIMTNLCHITCIADNIVMIKL